MAIRSDSYGSVAEVVAFTRHLLDGEVSFTPTSNPTEAAVEKFIDRASGVLNMAIYAAGFTPATIAANAVAKLACDDWVVMRAVAYTEMTQEAAGYDGSGNTRAGGFLNLHDAAKDFVMDMRQAWINAGLSVSVQKGRGVAFTGLTAQRDRTDPDDTSLEQPAFKRRLFDEPGTKPSDYDEDDD